MCIARAKFFLLFLLAQTAFASTAQLDTRFTTSASRGKLVDGLFLFHGGITSWLDGELGAKLGVGSDLKSWHSKGELIVPIIGDCRFHLRLHHVNYLSSGTSLTHVLPFVHLQAFPLDFIGVIARVGWYERFGRLSGTLPIPTFSSQYREHDFAASFGFEARPSDAIAASLILSTIEELEVYNLNNPFFEARVRYAIPDKTWTALAYFRYKLSLGFGRWDELTGGVGLSFPIESVSSRN